MDTEPLQETFAFLLSEERFSGCVEDHGPCYRQLHFRSAKIVLRIAEQDEITPHGTSVSCLAFLIDPENQNRWCMFEKAVEVMLGRKIEGSRSLQQLASNLRENIDPLLALLSRGKEPPFQDFSRFS